MKSNIKRNVCILIGVLVLVIIFYTLYKSYDVPKEEGAVVTMEKTSNAFYYDQLTEEEKSIYKLIREKGGDYHGGKVILEEPVSIDSYNRILTTLLYDEEYSYWPFVGAYPIDEKGKMVFAKESHDEKIIQKLYVQMFDFEPKNSGLDTFLFELSVDGTLLNEEELERVLENNTLDESIFCTVTDEIAGLKDEIVSEMPEGISQKEAILFFSDWLQDNMNYDTELMNYYGTLEYEEPSARLQYAEDSSELCIRKQKAYCGGLAKLLSGLCNQVGIQSYVVCGEIRNRGNGGAHGWAAVQIDGEIYYYDPTYVCITNKRDALMSKSRMEAERYDGRSYVFSNLFAF